MYCKVHFSPFLIMHRLSPEKAEIFLGDEDQYICHCIAWDWHHMSTPLSNSRSVFRLCKELGLLSTVSMHSDAIVRTQHWARFSGDMLWFVNDDWPKNIQYAVTTKHLVSICSWWHHGVSNSVWEMWFHTVYCGHFFRDYVYPKSLVQHFVQVILSRQRQMMPENVIIFAKTCWSEHKLRTAARHLGAWMKSQSESL